MPKKKQFSARLPDVIAKYLPGTGRYQVLFTDYTNFSILWSCSSIANLGYTGNVYNEIVKNINS